MKKTTTSLRRDQPALRPIGSRPASTARPARWRAPDRAPRGAPRLPAWPAAAAVLLAFWAPWTAAARRTPSLVVLPFQSAVRTLSNLDAEKLTALVLDAVRQSKAFQPMGVEAVGRAIANAQPQTAPTPEELLTAARRYARGRAHLAKRDFEGARLAFTKAIEEIERNLAHLKDFGLLADIHLYHGVSQSRTGDARRRNQSLRRALLIAPDRKLDPRRFPAPFRRLVGDIVASIRGGPKGSMSVTSAPPGCPVLVDGKERGKTPVTVSALPVGTHYVQVRCAGREPDAMIREVTAGGVVKATLKPAPLRRGKISANPLPKLLSRLRRGLSDSRTVVRAQQIALRSLADLVIFGYVTRSGESWVLHPFVFRAEGGALKEIPPLRFDRDWFDADAQAKNLASAIETTAESLPAGRAALAGSAPIRPSRTGGKSELRGAGDFARLESKMHTQEVQRASREERESRLVQPGPEVFGKAPAVGDDPVYKKWWFWTIIGAVVVGGVGAAAGAAASGGGSADISLRWGPR